MYARNKRWTFGKDVLFASWTQVENRPRGVILELRASKPASNDGRATTSIKQKRSKVPTNHHRHRRKKADKPVHGRQNKSALSTEEVHEAAVVSAHDRCSETNKNTLINYSAVCRWRRDREQRCTRTNERTNGTRCIFIAKWCAPRCCQFQSFSRSRLLTDCMEFLQSSVPRDLPARLRSGPLA